MLDTAVYETNYEYGSPASYGRISQKTLQWIEQCSQLAQKKHARIVTVMHHNLFPHSYLIKHGVTLDNSEEIRQVFERCGLNLVLSGHSHVQDINPAAMPPLLSMRLLQAP